MQRKEVSSMKSFLMTNTGRERDVNQDYVYMTNEPVGILPNLYIVADGMGGHNAGDFASRFAVKVLLEDLESKSGGHPEQLIRDAVAVVNKKLIEEAAHDSGMDGMGTTLVVATMIDNTMYFANVGDSRLYLIRDNIHQLTCDHSLVQEMVRMGGMGEEEAKNHPDKNIITRAIGAKEGVEVDLFEQRLEQEDIILMCTDGLSNMVEDEEIYKIVKSSRDLVEGVERLIEKANENGGRDNIGVILIEPYADEAHPSGTSDAPKAWTREERV